MNRILLVFFLLFSIFGGLIVISPTPAHAVTSYLAAMANGNLTSNTTWYVIDTTSYLDSEASHSHLTTSYKLSSAFTPGAITCDGIAVKVMDRGASPTTQTFTTSLYNSTDSTLVAGTELAIKVSNVPAVDASNGWVFFKWGAPVLLEAAHNYKVQAKTSASSMITLYTDSTADNHSRYLRTTTAQAPVAGDVMHIQREYTGSDAGTSWTVTMDSVASTDYGAGTDGVVAMTIGNGCHLTYGTTAATNYYLKLSGNLIVYNGGYLDVGTVGSEMPRDSTAVLEFDPVADGGMGLTVNNGGYLNMQGLSRTSGKNIVSCKLNTDEAIGQTVLGVDTDTGWLSGDEIGIASTTRTYSQCEKRTLSGNATATELTVGVALTYAHSGTSPTQAEVINLTRNVKLRSATSTLVSYVYIKSTAVSDIDWSEFYYLGTAAVGKYGIVVETTTGSFDMQYSSIHDGEHSAFYGYFVGLNNIIFSNNVVYGVGGSSGYFMYIGNNTSASNITVNNNIFIYSIGYGVTVSNVSITITDNTVASVSNTGFYLGTGTGTTVVFTGNTSHSHGDYGFYFYNINTPITIDNLTIWRCTDGGLCFYEFNTRDIIVSNSTFFGNGSYNILCIYCNALRITFDNCTLNGEASYPTINGLGITSNGALWDCTFNDCSFGTTVAHTNDINIVLGSYSRIILNDCTLASANEVVGTDKLDEGSYIKSYNHDLGGTTKIWVRNGEIAKETTIFKTATPSFLQTPSSVTVQQAGEKWLIPCDSGELVTVKIWSRWDSANTPSTKPQVKLNGCGIVESVGTNTSATTVWEELTVSGTPTSDGCLELVPYALKSTTATSVYWDDISITYAGGGSKNTGGLKYWFEAMPKYVYYALQNAARSFGIIIGN